MGISDRIEAFIDELLKDTSDDWLELGRNELASLFGCAPSQINYVISTRFGPENGYSVESRRGGGGYLRIRQIKYEDGIIMRTIKSIGDSIDEKTARACISGLVRQGAADERVAAVMQSGVSDSAIAVPAPMRDEVRAGILKSMLAALK